MSPSDGRLVPARTRTFCSISLPVAALAAASIRKPRAFSERIDELAAPARRNVTLVREAVRLRPSAGQVVRPEEQIPRRRVYREVLVDALRLGAVVPMVKGRRDHDTLQRLERPPYVGVNERGLHG